MCACMCYRCDGSTSQTKSTHKHQTVQSAMQPLQPVGLESQQGGIQGEIWAGLKTARNRGAHPMVKPSFRSKTQEVNRTSPRPSLEQLVQSFKISSSTARTPERPALFFRLGTCLLKMRRHFSGRCKYTSTAGKIEVLIVWQFIWKPKPIPNMFPTSQPPTCV